MYNVILLISVLLFYGINQIHSEIRHFNYPDLKALQDKPNEPLHIIDVREQYEVDGTGMIPGSIHVPSREIESALNLMPTEFQRKYNAKKPKPDENLMFICKDGERSIDACKTAVKCGYKNAINYPRGWFDWKCKSLKTPISTAELFE